MNVNDPHRAPSTLARYWAKVDTSGGPDACHMWTAATSHNGYGVFWDGTYVKATGLGRYVRATRWAWREFVGDIPAGMLVCHTCDNPGCMNQRHHFLGTTADNMADRDAKGRGGGPKIRGAANGCAKLTEQQVADIRTRYAAGGISQAALGREYGVIQQSIWQIVNGKTWAHLTSAA